MASSRAFEAACESLERLSSLDRLESRGTVRLLLGEAGLDARGVGSRELAVAIEKLLPGELEARGVADAAGIAARLRDAVRGVDDEPAADAPRESPEAVFARLGG